MVILHLLAPAEAGGLERVVQSLAIGQHRQGHHVTVASVVDEARPTHPFHAPLENAGVHVHSMVVPPRWYLRERSLIVDLCRSVRPDVVHSHGYRSDVVDGSGVRSLGIPMVSTAHGFTGGGWRNRLYERVQVAALRRFDAVVAVSRPVAARLLRRGVNPERIYIVPNAWSEIVPPFPRAVARAKLGISDERFLVGWVGRMTYEKGLDVFLEALGCLGELPVSASILGQGPECVSGKARAQSLNLAGRVRWVGLEPEASRLFPAFDVFVLSSRTEGVPIVLFEAMAAGVPIAATRVGGVPDVLSAADALLLPPDDPAAVAGAIRTVYTDPSTARLRASAARQKLHDRFGLLPWLQAYETIYRQCSAPAERQDLPTPPTLW